MNTLWTFGDSFTFGHGCRPDGPLPEYYNNYKKDGDDTWPNLLGSMLNTKVKNFGKCGASNDYILDSIIDNFIVSYLKVFLKEFGCNRIINKTNKIEYLYKN